MRNEMSDRPGLRHRVGRALARTAWVLGLGAALGGLAGCGSCDREKGDPAGMPAKVTLLSAPLEGLQAPPEALAYGGTGPLSEVTSALGGLATQAGLPVPPLNEQLALALKAEFNLKDDKVVDLAQGLRFAVLDPKKHAAEPVALIFGMKTKDAFIAALPDDRKTDDEGNAFSYLRFPGSSQAIYINFVLGTVVVTRDKAIFPQYRNFLERLAMADIDTTAGVVFAVRNLAAIYGPDLDAALAELKKTARAAVSAFPGAGHQAWIIDGVTDAIGRMGRELDDARLRLSALPDGLRVEATFQPKPNTALATTFAGLKGPGTGATLDRIPADAPFFLWLNLPPERLGAHADRVAQMTVGAMLKSAPDTMKVYNQTVVDALAAMSGEVVVAAHGPLTGDGLALTTLFGVRDAAKARAAQAKLTEVSKEPGAVEYYKKAGLEVEMKAGAYTLGDAPVSVITTRIGATNPQLAAMKDGLAELLTQHVAVGNDLGVVAVGSDARATVEGVLGGKLAGGLRGAAGPARALKLAAPNPFAMLYVSPVEVARRVRLGGMNPVAPLLEGISATTGIGLSLGSEAGALRAVFDLPVEQAQKIGQVVQKSKGAF
jgi:hypothetical protein